MDTAPPLQQLYLGAMDALIHGKPKESMNSSGWIPVWQMPRQLRLKLDGITFSKADSSTNNGATQAKYYLGSHATTMDNGWRHLVYQAHLRLLVPSRVVGPMEQQE
jgi:hypothetical protein